MARVLLIGSRYAPRDRSALEELRAWVDEAGHQATLWTAPADDRPGAFLAAARAAVQANDGSLIVLDGSPPDPASAVFLALTRVVRRRNIVLRSDARALSPDTDAARFAHDLCDEWIPLETWDRATVMARLFPALEHVRVFAGALVRDSVPQLLKEEGRSLAFRQVDDREYPAVLKRKLVETAQRLEDAEWGVEQEEIADLLELLETLLQVRKYDRESLRSIKEGKWRKRGGFQKGYLLEEEPKVSSR